MITTKTGTGSSWDRFMLLTAQARERNNGLGATSVRTGVNRAASISAGTTAKKGYGAAVPTGNTIASLQGYTRLKGNSEVKQGRILGGKFDAWA